LTTNQRQQRVGDELHGVARGCRAQALARGVGVGRVGQGYERLSGPHRVRVGALRRQDVVLVAGAQRAAELCAINILAQAKAALNGDLGRIRRILKLNGFVASVPEFTEQHLVINGASNLIADILGDAGKHARAAVGMAALPFNASVEIDAIIEIDA